MKETQKIKGILKLNGNKKEIKYGLFNKGEYIDLHEIINSSLGDILHITVKDNEDNIKFDNQGELLYQKLDKGFYELFVGDKNLDEVLWNLIEDRININIITIAEGRMED